MATAIIPAFNEEESVGAVVDTARASPLIDAVLVADGGSDDQTVQAAEAAGADTLVVAGGGKGEAMAAGVAATDDDVIVFLDADLHGLRPDHIDRLVRSVATGGAAMACGLFDRGRWMNPWFVHVGPVLTGERALRRELFESLAAEDTVGYRIEAALNARAAELDLPVAIFVCDGMWHRTKEEKADTPREGLRAKVAMLWTAWANSARFLLRRPVRRLRASRSTGRSHASGPPPAERSTRPPA